MIGAWKILVGMLNDKNEWDCIPEGYGDFGYFTSLGEARATAKMLIKRKITTACLIRKINAGHYRSVEVVQ